MEEINGDKDESITNIAKRMVEQYARGLLSAAMLEELIQQEFHKEQSYREGEEYITQHTYRRIAQRMCSRVLCAAWLSPDVELRERAFDNIRCYLEVTLKRSSHVAQWPHTMHSLEDVLHQSLETLYKLRNRGSGGPSGPDDPDRFIKWTQTIALRQAYAFAKNTEPINVVSLDQMSELFPEQYVEKSEPLNAVLSQEREDIVARAILSLRNPHYRSVIFYTYFLELDGAQIAKLMGVQVQEVYMWRRRALQALGKHPEIIQLLRSLRE